VENLNKDNTAKGYMAVRIIMKERIGGNPICNEITSTKPLEVVVDTHNVLLRVIKKSGKTTTTVFGTAISNVLYWLVIE
jgi:hypothetical protein